MDEQGIESNPRHEGKLQSPQGDKRKEPGGIKLNIMYFLWFKHLNSKTQETTFVKKKKKNQLEASHQVKTESVKFGGL